MGAKRPRWQLVYASQRGRLPSLLTRPIAELFLSVAIQLGAVLGDPGLSVWYTEALRILVLLLGVATGTQSPDLQNAYTQQTPLLQRTACTLSSGSH